MSIITSTPQQICGSPLNTSTSKFLYSFSKADRFGDQSKSKNHAFYDLPPIRMRRSAAFGYGGKYDFTKNGRSSPPPGTYDVKSEIEIAKEKKFGKTFGLGRSEVDAPLNNVEKNKPGPGAYDIPNALSKVSFSFRPKTNDVENMTSNLKNPGPGTYKAYDTINDKGKHFVSKYKSSGASIINPARSERFKEFNPVKQNPGPGTYNQPQTIDKNGKYFVSRYQSSMCRSFSQASRKGLNLSTAGIPGPGSYRIPSDFGYYEAKNAEKSPEHAGKKKSSENQTQTEKQEK